MFAPRSRLTPRPPGCRRSGPPGRVQELAQVLAQVLAVTAWLLLPGQAECGARGASFGFEEVVAQAGRLASEVYREPARVPDFLININFDQWRDIRFKNDRTLWGGKIPFGVRFFHPGLYYDRPVIMNTVEDGVVRRIEFSPDDFDYGRNDFSDKVPRDLGFAGFRIHYPINRKSYLDEVAVFLGASYFRAVGRNMVYGLSARGLALNTALPSGEEFPFFREFWLVRPRPNASTMTVYALMDSPSLAGAYEFVIAPGRETAIDARLRLFPRKPVEKLGLAPLTSMFFYGETTPRRPVDDFRPEVHDSDGLMLHAGGEWLWRPLKNPRDLSVSAFQARDLQGFGIMQRDLSFDSYQDLEARYDKRPSCWITPRGKWGEGRVELVSIPTTNEYNDNIIAYFVPKDQPRPGQSAEYAYRMSWRSPDKSEPPAGRTLHTFVAAGRDENTRKIVVDFTGEKLQALPADKAVTGVVTVGEGGLLVEQQLTKNQVNSSWRLVFQVNLAAQGPLEKVLPDRREPVELRAYLKLGDDILTETWSYALTP